MAGRSHLPVDVPAAVAVMAGHDAHEGIAAGVAGGGDATQVDLAAAVARDVAARSGVVGPLRVGVPDLQLRAPHGGDAVFAVHRSADAHGLARSLAGVDVDARGRVAYIERPLGGRGGGAAVLAALRRRRAGGGRLRPGGRHRGQDAQGARLAQQAAALHVQTFPYQSAETPESAVLSATSSVSADW